MKKILKGLTRILPAYGIFPVIFSFVFNCLVYSGSRMIAGGWYHHNIETGLDRSLPFVPQFLVVYFGCYLFWAANYILIARRGREEWFRFFWAHLCAELICGVFFVLMPTTNVRPEVSGGDLASQLVVLLYQLDPPQNLFPSIHCLISWLCFAGVRSDRRIPLWYRGFNCVFALAVCASTLFLKQHVIPDVLSGILLAEFTYAVALRTPFYRPLQRLLDRESRREPLAERERN